MCKKRIGINTTEKEQIRSGNINTRNTERHHN